MIKVRLRPIRCNQNCNPNCPSCLKDTMSEKSLHFLLESSVFLVPKLIFLKDLWWGMDFRRHIQIFFNIIKNITLIVQMCFSGGESVTKTKLSCCECYTKFTSFSRYPQTQLRSRSYSVGPFGVPVML